MIKKDIVKIIQNDTGLKKAEIVGFLNALYEIIILELKELRRVDISGFGSFQTKYRSKKGEAYLFPFLTPAKQLIEEIDDMPFYEDEGEWLKNNPW